MADELEELAEVEVGGRKRAGPLTRMRKARDRLAEGTILPRVQALISPSLYRERGDTNNLVEDAFAEDGPLGRMAASNPELAAELRGQAGKPMSSQQHQEFRSSLLQLIGSEVEKESKVRAQVADNAAFMEAFSVLDGFIPGAGDGRRDTLEESERRQIGMLFEKAQALAVLDPEASKAVMVEARKKADTLTANVRQFIEKNRRDAMLEDRALWANATEQVNETDDVIRSLMDDLDEKGTLRDPNPAIIARAYALLGRAGDLPTSSLSEAGEGIAGSVAAATGNDNAESIAAIIAAGGKKLLDKGMQGRNVNYLIERLQFNKALVQEGYQTNRKQLAERYKPLGIEIGEQAGEVYAVANEAYKAEAEKIPATARTPEGERQDRTASLRTMLESEQQSADAAVESLRADAAANLPGAAARLASAMLRQQVATDDLAIFEDDLRVAAGTDMSSLQGIDINQAEQAIQLARARRKNRSDASTRAAIRRQMQDSLRSHTR